jgi:hypothetical protein
MQPFLALITPIGGGSGPVDPGFGRPSPPYWGQAGDPGYSPPWARPPVDPGYSPPWARPRPPVDPGYSPPWATLPPGVPGPGGPVDPGYSPPWARPGPPLGIWGPGDPRPTLPIAGWDPIHGTWPTPPVQPPLGIWGPGDPRPTQPIAGFDPIHGTWPKPPRPPGTAGQLPASDPSGSGWVFGYVPGWGWMWSYVPQVPPTTTPPPPTDPEAVGPAHPIQPTVPEPKT